MNHEKWNYLADSPDHDLFYHLLNVIPPFHVIKSRRSETVTVFCRVAKRWEVWSLRHCCVSATFIAMTVYCIVYKYWIVYMYCIVYIYCIVYKYCIVYISWSSDKNAILLSSCVQFKNPPSWFMYKSSYEVMIGSYYYVYNSMWWPVADLT